MKQGPSVDASKVLKRTGLVIGTSYLVLELIDPNSGILQLPLQWLLKEHLHLSAASVASFFAVALSPWYFKPLAALLSDALPVFGSRRRFYLVFGAAVATLSTASLAFVPQERLWLLPLVILVHTALMTVSTVTGGLLVELGQRYHSTGGFTSLRYFADNAAVLAIGPIGGSLAGVYFGWPAGICAGLSLLLAIVFATLLKNLEPAAPAVRNFRALVVEPLFTVVCSRGVWIAVALYACYHLAPGFQTPLFFYQRDVLHLSPQFLGTLDLFNASAGVLGTLAYAVCSRRLAFKWLLPVSTVIGVAATTFYLGYESKTTAMLVETGSGFFGTFAFVALLDFVARIMPKSYEALGYAVVFSVGNIAMSVADVIGSHWFDTGTPFTTFVWLKVLALSLIAVAICRISLWKNSRTIFLGESGSFN